MAEVKDKVVTVESLAALHDYDENTYFKKSGGDITGNVAITGDVSITNNATVSGDIYTTDIYIKENGNAKGFMYGLNPDGEYVGNLQLCNENYNCVIGYGTWNHGTGNVNIYSAQDINMTLKDSEHTVFSARNAHNNMQINHSGYVNNNSKTYIYGSDIYLRPTAAEYKPYFSAGDTITFSISTAGYVTSGGKEVALTIPIAKPIVGNPTLTLTTDGGMVLRQGGYTHGSSASVGVYASSYTISSQASGSYISARGTFTDTTGVTNNSPIGISWSGTITLS